MSVEERVHHLENWINAMRPIVFGADARLNMLEQEPPDDMLKPSFVRRMSRRSLLTRDEMAVMQKQISVLFDRINRVESLMESKMNKPLKVRVIT